MKIPKPPKLPKARPLPESAIHIGIVRILGLACPDHVLWSHFPSGEARSIQTGAKLRRMGLKPGWPDLIFIDLLTGYVHVMEVKAKKGTLSPAQKAWYEQFCKSPTGRFAVVRSVEEAYGCLVDWWPNTTRKMTVGVRGET